MVVVIEGGKEKPFRRPFGTWALAVAISTGDRCLLFVSMRPGHFPAFEAWVVGFGGAGGIMGKCRVWGKCRNGTFSWKHIQLWLEVVTVEKRTCQLFVKVQVSTIVS